MLCFVRLFQLIDNWYIICVLLQGNSVRAHVFHILNLRNALFFSPVKYLDGYLFGALYFHIFLRPNFNLSMCDNFEIYLDFAKKTGGVYRPFFSFFTINYLAMTRAISRTLLE